MVDGQYPPAEEYWVSPDHDGSYPLRYGDMCVTPELDQCRTGKGRLWDRILVLSPSCELGDKAAPDTQVLVARVNPVSNVSANQRGQVRVGWVELSGRMRIAHANTFWMPPTPLQDDDGDWYADFRRLQSVPLSAIRQAGRVAALTHDARIYLIRREAYFKYRWLLPHDVVLGLESERIRNDLAFQGPRPNWA